MNIPSGESILRTDAGIPIVSRLQTRAWIWFATDLLPVAREFLHWVVPNDMLAVWIVAVALAGSVLL